MKALRIILIILIVAAAGFAVYNFVFKQTAKGEMKVNESSVKLLDDKTKIVAEIDPTLISTILGTVFSSIDGAPDIKISNLAALGIDDTKHILLGSSQGQIDFQKAQAGEFDASVELVIPLKDSNKFEGFITPLTADMAKNKLMKCTVLEQKMLKVAWDATDLLVVVSNNVSASDIDNKFNRTGKMLDNKNFVEYLVKGKDAGFWGITRADDYKTLIDELKKRPEVAGVMNFEIFDGLVEKMAGAEMYSHTMVNFEKGKVVARSDAYYNASAKRTIYGFLKSINKTIDTDMIERLPSDGLMVTMFAFDLDALLTQILDFVKTDEQLAAQIAQGEAMLSSMGIGIDKVLALFEGNFAITLGNNISNPSVSALVKIKDKSILENELIKAQIANLKTSRGTYAIGYGEIAITDNYIGYSNNPKTVADMANNEKFESSKSGYYKQAANGKSSYFYFSFEGIPEVIDLATAFTKLEQDETDLLYGIRNGIDKFDFVEGQSTMDHSESTLQFKNKDADSREELFSIMTPVIKLVAKAINEN